MLLELLQENPHKDFQFDDDFETKSMVLELGLSGRFSKNLPGVPRGEQSQQFVSYNQNPTHWIHIILYLGHPDPKENGYVILCYPRGRVSYLQSMEFAKMLLTPTDERISATRLFWDSSDN
jgi:hypothetical protein